MGIDISRAEYDMKQEIKARDLQQEYIESNWRDFKERTVEKVLQEIESEGDIIRLLDEISIGYDDCCGLEDSEVLEILTEAYKLYLGV